MVAVSWTIEGVCISLLKQQSWFVPHAVGTIAKYNIPETTTLFLVSVFLLSGCGVAVSFGATWRQPLWTNYGLIAIWILQIATLCFVYIVPHLPSEAILYVLDMVALPSDFRLIIAVLSGCTALLIILWEKLVIMGPVGGYLREKTGRGRPEPVWNPIWG